MAVVGIFNKSSLLVLSSVLVACQGGKVPPSCSSTQAVSNANVSKLTTGGGILILEGLSFSPAQENKSVTSQCSAFVRVVSKSAEIFKSQIWTARHCLPDFSSRIMRSDLRLFDGRNAYVQLDISLSLAQARDGFFNLVAAKIPEFIDTEKKQKNPARIALNYTFLEEEGKKNYGAECKRNGASETVSETLLCSALQDFRLFDADIRPKTKIGSEILNSLLTRENDSNRRGATESIVKQWQLAVTRQMEMELDISRGRFVDMLLQCSEKTPSAVCNYKDTLQILARKWRAPGRDLIAEAEKDGYFQPGKSYSEYKKSRAQNHYNSVLLPLFSKLQASIQSENLGLIFAGNFADADGKSWKFSSAPLKDFFTSQGMSPQFDFFSKESSRDLFFRFESPPGKNLVLSAGDSGSALLLDDSTPFLLLSAKGSSSISGGAAILALPEPSNDEVIVSRPTGSSCR